MLRSVFFFLLFATVVLGENEHRTRKASKVSLSRLKRLINEKTEKDHAEQKNLHGLQNDAPLVTRNPDAAPHHDELSVNNLDDYFQGDMELSEAQVTLLEREIKEVSEDKKSRKRRKVGKEPLYKRWDRTRPISFEFTSSIPQDTEMKIRMAMDLWQQKTCIRFKKNGPDVDRLEFFDGGGCSSFVGRTGGTQGISISTPGCDYVGIISHEIGHALGMFHEQARPDQSSFISVNYRNIPISRWNNFYPVSLSQSDIFGLPYEAGSVMHYGGYGFASDPYTPTISTLDKNLQGTIGQRTGPSFLDFAAINIAYRCFEHCGYIPCQHHGYPNPNNCSECLCPEGFSGSLCQYVQYTSCGAHIEVSRDAVSISSPNYPYQFNRNSDCVWFLKAPVGGKVFFEFEDTFQFQCEDTCDKSFVEVKPGPDFRITGYRFCCSVRPKQRFEAFGGKMLVFLRGFGERSRGFKARVWSDVSPVTPVSTSTSTTTTTTTYTTTTTAIPTTTVSVPPSSTEQTENETSSVVQPEEIPIWTTENPSESTFEMVLETITDTPTESIKSTPKAVKPAPVAVITEWPRPVPVVSPITPLTVAPVDECGCKRWSEWQGSCSQDCGGCGKRRRTRVCLKENCRSEEKRACNFGICPPGTNFLINNGEFHILWKGCCVGLFRSGRSCSTLEDGDNPFLKIISSLLSPSDSRRNATALTSVPHV